MIEEIDPNDLEQEDFENLAEDFEVLEAEDHSAPIDKPIPGCTVSFYADNKLHHALCLAVLGGELLLEHKGASRCYLFTGKVVKIVPRLRAGVASATIIVGALKSCRYRSLAKRWLWEMIATGQCWKGIEPGGDVAPSPAELLDGDYQMELF